MRTTRKKHRQGFTLIELLTVIAILGLLAGLVAAVIPLANTAAHKSTALSNLRGIIASYGTYVDSNRPITEGSNAEQGQASSPALFAEVLARYAQLEQGTVWYIEDDPRLDGKEIPQRVLQNGRDGTNLLQAVSPISWAVVVGASKGRVKSTDYPLVWTRGLETSGKWRDDSPWQGAGGHIAFGDGHVEWYTNLNIAGKRLSHYTTRQETSSYVDAIGENARVKEDNG